MDEPTMNRLAASEIRAWAARRQISGRQLAQRMARTQTWTSTRMRGEQEITLNDLAEFARALDVEITELLPAPARRESTRYNLPAPPRSHDTTRPADLRPGHTTPTLTARPISTPINRTTSDRSTPPRDRRPARLHTRREDGHNR